MTRDTEPAEVGVHTADPGASMKRLAIGLVCAVAFLGAPRQASATSIQFLGFGKASGLSATPPSAPVLVTLADAASGGNPLANFNQIAVTVGELNWQFVGGTPAGYTSNFYAYCAELTEAVQPNQNIAILSTDFLIPTNPAGSGDAFSGKKAAWLFNTYAPGINSAANDLNSRQSAAALQVAIWEAIYDTTNNLADGFFRLNSGGNIATKAISYLTSLYSAANYDEGSWFKTNGAGLGQDLILGPSNAPPVPEPGTLLLFGIGLAGLAHVRARQRALRQASSKTQLS